MAEYLRVTPHDGETFEELVKRLDLNFFRGSGYYKVTRQEKISATKDLVLSIDNKTSYIAGPAAVRSKLKLGSGSVTVKPIDIPNEHELFVQSTSWNRKLRDGHDVLFRKSTADSGRGGGVTVSLHSSAAAASTPAIKSSPKKSPSKKRAKSAESDDDDDTHSNNQRKSPRTRARRGGPDRSKANDDNDPSPPNDDAVPVDTDDIVIWSKLRFDLQEEVESLDAESLVVGAEESGVPGDCDLPIPNNLIEGAVSFVVEGVIRGVTTWRQFEQTVVQPDNANRPFAPDTPFRRYQWHSNENGGSRLMYVDSPNATFIAVECRGLNYGLVCGNNGAHPFVQSPTFLYCNSDGSSQDTALNGGLITPEIVLAKLVHDTVLHCQNEEH